MKVIEVLGEMPYINKIVKGTQWAGPQHYWAPDEQTFDRVPALLIPIRANRVEALKAEIAKIILEQHQ